MKENTNKLFVYGSLLENIANEYSRFLKQNSYLWGTGFFHGNLFDIGEYPGAVYDPNLKSKVWGNVYILKNQTSIFDCLDEYEGYGNNSKCEFIRTIIDIHIGKLVVKSWVYLYNLPTEKISHISNGNYLNYLEAKT